MEARLPLWKRTRLRNKNTNMVMRFGTWNVHTLLQAGNMNIIAEEAERYKMDVVALQEILWKGRAQLGNRNALCTIPEMTSDKVIEE